ncbi:hypothetical protein COM01_22335 [Bacillus wiedmannii]|nr:hypothetical protein COM01_22335 [Bacillus wiedmannii]
MMDSFFVIYLEIFYGEKRPIFSNIYRRIDTPTSKGASWLTPVDFLLPKAMLVLTCKIAITLTKDHIGVESHTHQAKILKYPLNGNFVFYSIEAYFSLFG